MRFLALLILAMVTGCASRKALERDFEPMPPPEIRAQRLALQAWPLMENHQFEQALALFEQARAFDPDNHRAFEGLLLILAHEDQTAAMEDLYWDRLSRHPDEEGLYLGLLGLLDAQDRERDALVVLSQYLEHFPDDVASHFRAANLAEKYHLQKEAIHHYTQVVERDPDHHEAMNNLGIVLLQVDELEEAAAWFLKAHALATNQDTYLFHLGLARERQGQVKDAETAYRLALRLNSKDPMLYYRLGLVLIQQGRKPEAKSLLLEGKKRFPAAVNWKDALKGL